MTRATTVDPPVLADLGIHRMPVPIPIVEAGGPVNVYAIEDQGGGLALFDAGLGTEKAEAWLRRSFDLAGLNLRDVRRILISHGHVDHYGAAELVRAESGAPIYLHPADRDKTRRAGAWMDGPRQRYQTYLRRLGLADQVVRMLSEVYDKTQEIARPIEDTLPLLEGDVFHFARFSARVLHVPGHSPGQVMLHDAAHRVLLSADHVLEKVAPSPFIELGPGGEEDPHRSLLSYLGSARRTHALDVDWVLPGHNAPFRGHRPVLERFIGFYEQRVQRVLARVMAKPAGALQLVFDLHPAARPQAIYLLLSEVVGCLEVLEQEGCVVREERDGAYIWRGAAERRVAEAAPAGVRAAGR